MHGRLTCIDLPVPRSLMEEFFDTQRIFVLIAVSAISIAINLYQLRLNSKYRREDREQANLSEIKSDLTEKIDSVKAVANRDIDDLRTSVRGITKRIDRRSDRGPDF